MPLKEYFDTHPAIYYSIGIVFLISGISISLIYSLLGWGSILISIGIASIVIGISRKSEMMTKAIADSSLLETIGVFEDRRLGIRERFKKIQEKTKIIKNYSKNSTELQLDLLDYTIYYSFSIWKCKTYLDRTMIFEKYFSENDENQLIHHIDCLFQDLCLGKQHFNIKLINKENIRHLESMYDTISQFNRFNLDNIEEKPRRERILTNLNVLKGLSASPKFFV